MNLAITPIQPKIRQYKQQIPVSFGALNPVPASSTPVNDTFTVQDNKAVQNIIRDLMSRKDFNRFVDGKMTLGAFYKEVSDVYKLGKYIEQHPVLAKFGKNLSDVIDLFVSSKKYKIDINLNLEDRKPALEKLIKLAEDKSLKRLFDKIGNDAFYDIVAFNSDPIADISKTAMKNANVLFSSKVLKPLLKNVKDDNIYDFVITNMDGKQVTKNLEILDKMLKKQEFSFLPSAEIDSSVLHYSGNLKKLLIEFAKKASQLQPSEKINLKILPENDFAQIKTYIKDGSDITSTSITNYDRSMNSVSSSFTAISVNEKGEKTANTNIIDYMNNAKYTVERVYDKKYKKWLLMSQIKEQTDSSGNPVKKEILKASNAEGVFDVVNVDKNGKTEEKCSVNRTDKEMKIKKNLVSADGTRTFFDYKKFFDTKNESFSYKIVDKDGKTLAQKTRSVRYLNKNTAIHNINGKLYKVLYSPSAIKIIDENLKKSYTIDFSLYMDGMNYRSFKTMLRELPADELIKMNEKVGVLKKTKDTKSHYMFSNKLISSSNDPFVFEHELGHAKDEVTQNVSDLVSNHKFQPDKIEHCISSDKKLMQIFEKERKLYFKAYPTYITSYTSYFTGRNAMSDKKSMLQEVVAETNAIINTPVFSNWIAHRTHYLQENFPKTIAYLMTHKL